MRYRIEEQHLENKEHASQNIVDTTVALTLLIGIIFVLLGLKGSQRWLVIWGIITFIMCLLYFSYRLFHN